jgi:hypothetical protein
VWDTEDADVEEGTEYEADDKGTEHDDPEERHSKSIRGGSVSIAIFPGLYCGGFDEFGVERY